MSLIKWDPFREFNTLPARLAFWGKDWEEPLSTTRYVPSVDIFETDNEVVVKIGNAWNERERHRREAGEQRPHTQG